METRAAACLTLCIASILSYTTTGMPDLILPVELWLACWRYCSKRQLRRLSLACKLFRSICLPLLLERQTADIAALAHGLTRYNWVERTRCHDNSQLAR